MKKIFFLFLIALFLFSFPSENELSGGVAKEGKYKKVLSELKIKLALDESQIKKIDGAFSAAESQRRIDVDIFRTSSLALIRAAERRCGITDSRIKDVLRDNQKSSFDNYRKERETGKELFKLREGLLLTREQMFKVELVVSEYENILKRLYGKLGFYVRSGKDRNKKSSQGERLLKDRSGGLERRNPGVVKMEKNLPEKIGDIQNEKAERIRKFLTSDQNVLYSELLKFQKQELRAYIRKLRK